MYCRHCGKELSDEAFMCPNCGTPTGTEPPKKKVQNEESESSAGGVNTTALSVVTFIISMFAFVTGVIYGALFYVYTPLVTLFIISVTSILPALAGLVIGAYLLVSGRDKLSDKAKTYAIVSIVLSSVVLFFLFITSCLAYGL